MDFYGINSKANITTDGVSDIEIENLEDGGTITIKANDSGSVSTDMIKADPDGSVDLYHDGALVSQTTVAGITGAVWG
jgi:hypothetical protein